MPLLCWPSQPLLYVNNEYAHMKYGDIELYYCKFNNEYAHIKYTDIELYIVSLMTSMQTREE